MIKIYGLSKGCEVISWEGCVSVGMDACMKDTVRECESECENERGGMGWTMTNGHQNCREGDYTLQTIIC